RVRRRHYPAGMTARDQFAVDAKAARPRLVDEHQLPTQRLELAHRSPQRIHVAADLTVMTNLVAFLGHRDIDRFLVHVHTHIQLPGARLAIHGLPPVLRLTPSCSTCGPVWLATQSTIARRQASRLPGSHSV